MSYVRRSDIIDTTVLGAAEYNMIALPDDWMPNFDDLQRIGRTFIRQDVHRNFGLGLLHRYFKLTFGQAMVHGASTLLPRPHAPSKPFDATLFTSDEDDDAIADECSPTAVDGIESRLKPHMYYLAPGEPRQWQGFEYEPRGTGQPLPPEPFARELRDKLVRLELARLVCLVPYTAHGMRVPVDMRASALDNDAYCFAFRRPEERDADDVLTVWMFEVATPEDMEGVLRAERAARDEERRVRRLERERAERVRIAEIEEARRMELEDRRRSGEREEAERRRADKGGGRKVRRKSDEGEGSKKPRRPRKSSEGS